MIGEVHWPRRSYKNWGYDEGTVFYHRASANFIFTFTREGIPYFLRFNDSCEREVEAIEAELKIVQYVNENSLKAAQPVPSRNEKYIEEVETEWGLFYAVVFEALQGEHLDIEELTNEQTYSWGQSLGELHNTFKSMPDQFLMSRASWREQLKTAAEIIPESEKSAHRELKRLIYWAEGLRITNENFGLVHYDFELDNVLFTNLGIGMLDFDDCSSHWYMADIVYALRDAGDFDVNAPITIEFIKGYKSKTELDTSMIEEASSFERLHKVITFATIIRSVDIEESIDHPDWLSNLRTKLCGYIDHYRQSFEINN